MFVHLDLFKLKKCFLITFLLYLVDERRKKYVVTKLPKVKYFLFIKKIIYIIDIIE